MPLGHAVRGMPFRGPPGLIKGTAWPPSVTAAKRALDASKNRPTRGVFRSAITLFDYAGALAVRGMNEGAKGVDDLVEAFSIFEAISSAGDPQHFGRYRAVSLFNASACVSLLPDACARELSATLLLRSVQAIGDSLLEVFRLEFEGRLALIETTPDIWPVRWQGPNLLVPDHPKAVLKIRSLDVPIEGRWSGVREVLRSKGIEAPVKCALAYPIVQVRRGRGVLRVV